MTLEKEPIKSPEGEKKSEMKYLKDNFKDLVQEKEKLEAMFNNAINGIIRVDFDGNFVACNKAADKLFKNLYENFNINDFCIYNLLGNDLWKDIKEQTIKSKRIELHELYLENGEKSAWFYMNIVYQNPIGMAPYFEAFFQDITNKKEYELQIINLNKNLEKKVEERTKDLEDFAYVISHDLKAPLRAINQLSHWIREDYEASLDAEGKKILNLMEERIGTMESLINGVLEYSRVGRDKETSTIIFFDKFLNDIARSFAIEKNIEFKIHNHLDNVKGNRTKFLQLYQNIISNSIKYMDKPIGVIELITHMKGNEIELTIKDNGAGIEEKYLPHIFEIFNTAGKETSKNSTGIGLSIVKKIVDSFDGRISVESKVGEGTKFIVHIPKKEEYL